MYAKTCGFNAKNSKTSLGRMMITMYIEEKYFRSKFSIFDPSASFSWPSWKWQIWYTSCLIWGVYARIEKNMANYLQLILLLSLGLITHFFTPELESLLPLSSSLFWLTVYLLLLDLGENIGFQGLLETGMFLSIWNK